MVVGPSIGAVAKAIARSPEELKWRSAEHQKFMMEVANIQQEGGRNYYHEFPEGVDSMNTREASSLRCSKENF